MRFLFVIGAWMLIVPVEARVQAGAPGRSCDGRPFVESDTIVDSVDPVLRTMRPSGEKAPRYPADMRNAGVNGQVAASFVVDTLGRVPPGGVLIHVETRASFGNAVCAHLFSAKFTPLVVNGRRLSVRVENWPVSFDIRSRQP
jgi:outer membrane biosynthesis protein TonB